MRHFLAYTAGAAIPIGIAVGRQRLQEATTNQTIQQLQTKDLNRFGLGLADLGESFPSFHDCTISGLLSRVITLMTFFRARDSTQRTHSSPEYKWCAVVCQWASGRWQEPSTQSSSLNIIHFITIMFMNAVKKKKEETRNRKIINFIFTTSHRVLFACFTLGAISLI